jgi:Protein of unknown function (DUF1353)
MRNLLIFVAAIVLPGCASIHFNDTKSGGLKGKLIVEWIEPDEFIFRPDKNNPLTFTRSNKEVIMPGLMYTDGGSIPRPLWALRSYSPWGYAPAYIVHDWLFHMKHCNLPGNEKYTVEEAARVLSEVMKTLMVKQGDDKLTLYATFEAVRSPIAANLWNSETCLEPPTRLFDSKPKMRYVIEFP